MLQKVTLTARDVLVEALRTGIGESDEFETEIKTVLDQRAHELQVWHAPPRNSGCEMFYDASIDMLEIRLSWLYSVDLSGLIQPTKVVLRPPPELIADILRYRREINEIDHEISEDETTLAAYISADVAPMRNAAGREQILDALKSTDIREFEYSLDTDKLVVRIAPIHWFLILAAFDSPAMILSAAQIARTLHLSTILTTHLLGRLRYEIGKGTAFWLLSQERT